MNKIVRQYGQYEEYGVIEREGPQKSAYLEPSLRHHHALTIDLYTVPALQKNASY